MNQCAHGWPVLEQDETVKWVVPGAGRHLVTAPGAAGFLLAHLASWVHDQIEPLDGGVWDEWGYAKRRIRGTSETWSCHASGTAVDLNAQAHPMGSRGTWTAEQRARINARLERVYGKTIEWGASWSSRPDEMHFQVVAGPRAAVLAARRVALRRRARRLLDASGLGLDVLVSAGR